MSGRDNAGLGGTKRASLSCRPCESRDPYAAALVLRDAAGRLSCNANGCGYGSLLSQGRRESLIHLSVTPPSTTSSSPVTYLDSSEARNSAALATSQASPICPIGTWASRARHIASTSPLA